eukprot:9410516-Ditylum_brightwellii.AAC.1
MGLQWTGNGYVDKSAKSGETHAVACGLNPGKSATLLRGEDSSIWVGFVEPSWNLCKIGTGDVGASGVSNQAVQQ